MVRYFTRVRKDTAFVSSLTVTYERTVLPRVGLFVCRTIKRAHILFLIGSIFLLDFRLDDLNMLPDAIGIAFILGGIMTLCRYTRLPKGKFAFVLSIMIGISVGAYVMDMLFHMKYSYSAILRDVQAYDFFVVVCALSVLSVVLFTVLLAVLRNCANSVIDQHTGFTGEHFSKGDEKRLMDYHKELKRRFLYVYIMGMLVVAIDICRVILEYEYGYLGFLSIAVSAIFAATLYKQWGDIADCVETKYMLE